MNFVWCGEKLKVRRKELGLTTADVASKLNTSHGHITIWENDKASPNGSFLLMLAEVLNVAPKYFYNVSVDAEAAEGLLGGIDEKK